MGYPMPYRRMLHRNGLDDGGYDREPNDDKNPLRGDLRRFERDALDRNQLPVFAAYAGITTDQARKVITVLLDDHDPDFRAWFTANLDIAYPPGIEMWPDDPPGPYGPQWKRAVPAE